MQRELVAADEQPPDEPDETGDDAPDETPGGRLSDASDGDQNPLRSPTG